MSDPGVDGPAAEEGGVDTVRKARTSTPGPNVIYRKYPMTEGMISVVIPAKEEEGNIPELHRRLTEVLTKEDAPYEIILIDDGSEDDTLKVMISLQENDPNLRIIEFDGNFGQTSATKAGFDHSRGSIMVTMDSDLEHAPEDIPKALRKMEEGFDVVSSWRYDRRKERGAKRIPSKISNMLARVSTGVHVHDYGSGFKVYRRETLDGLELYGSFHRYIMALVAWKGYKIGEIRILHRVRPMGKTKYGAKRLVKGFIDLTYINMYLRRRFPPFGWAVRWMNSNYYNTSEATYRVRKVHEDPGIVTCSTQD